MRAFSERPVLMSQSRPLFLCPHAGMCHEIDNSKLTDDEDNKTPIENHARGDD